MRVTSSRWSTGSPVGVRWRRSRSPRSAGPRVATKPVRLVIGEGLDNWQTIATSRDWDAVIRLLSMHSSAGLSAEGQMTDAMLAELSTSKTSCAHGLSGSKEVTDEGVRHLARLPELQHLDLSGTRISDRGTASSCQLASARAISLEWDARDG